MCDIDEGRRPTVAGAVGSDSPEQAATGVATVHLMVGLPAAGKTARARELADQHGALRLTPDEWMIPLFGEPEADGKRDVLEGRLLWTAMSVAASGLDVVVDFGLWNRDERSALRWLFTTVGADCRIEYLDVDTPTQLARIRQRAAHMPEDTFEIGAAELEASRAVFDVPDAAELAGGPVPEPPAGYSTWAAWAATRWPSFPDTGLTPG